MKFYFPNARGYAIAGFATTSCIPRNNFTQNYQFVGNSNEEFQVVYCSKVFGVVKEAHKDKLLSLDIVQGDNRVIVQKEYSFQTTYINAACAYSMSFERSGRLTGFRTFHFPDFSSKEKLKLL